jgi:hypothetical protein
MKNEELDNIIEKSFRIEPDFQLPADFAQKVTFSVASREQWKNDLGEYLSLTAILLTLLSAVAGLYYYIDKEFVMQIIAFVSGNVAQVVFAVLLLNFILLTDRVLLRLLFSRWSRS